MSTGDTVYSERISGERGNYGWSVRFDMTDTGFLGISQFDGEQVKDRVLLSPDQVSKLSRFVSEWKRA